jgi:hypothetical protein
MAAEMMFSVECLLPMTQSSRLLRTVMLTTSSAGMVVSKA